MSIVLQGITRRVKLAHHVGQTAVALSKSGAAPATSYSLSGRLYATPGGWILLSVPNALVRGAFDALDEPGVQLPTRDTNDPNSTFNAHISVMRPEEIEGIPGGIDAISERGHSFHYTLGKLKSVRPAGWEGVSRCWMIEVHSPELQTLRKSYGLTPLPNDNEFAFHVTVAIRKKSILYDNEVSKAAEDEPITCEPGEPDLLDRVLGLKSAAILPQLAKVKQHSDAKQWAAKHALLRQLIAEHPDDFYEDSRERGFVGVTHAPSGYRFHLPAAVVPHGLKPRVKEEAAGIPSRQDLGDLSQLQPGQLVDWVVQRHLAQRAGEHLDYRLGSPETGLFSWASRKELPAPGQRTAWFQQPKHKHEYGDFEGEITEGYGKGTVSRQDRGQLLITKVSPGAIHFTLAHKKHPERFTLLKPAKWGQKDWLLVNNTPTETVPYNKVHFARIPADQVEQALAGIQEGTSVQAKVDGASSLVKLLKDGVELVSYRTSKTTGRPIVHTERVLGGRPELKIPPELVGTILRGEIYGRRAEDQGPDLRRGSGPGDQGAGSSQRVEERGATPGTALHSSERADATGSDQVRRVLHPSELGGLLNSSVAKSLADQRARGIQLRNMLFDVQQVGQEPLDLEQVPYAKRREWLTKILPHLPQDRFEIAPEVKTQEEARALWEQIRSGQHPLTQEGIVIHPPTGRPSKVKLTEDSDVHVTGIFPGEGKYQGVGAGGFEYGLQPGGPTVGRVGTGLSDELRNELWANQQDYVGRVARIRSQEQLPSGAWRAPSFMAFHEDYPTKTAGTLDEMPLQPQQQRVKDRFLEGEDRLLLFHGLGSGKSRAAIEAAEAAGDPYAAVVPASLRPNMAGEVRKWTNQQLPHQIVSYTSLARGADVPDPGTLILDESHRLRNPETDQVKAVRALSERTNRLLMLTGSPVVNSPGDLAVTLGLLTGQQMSPKAFEERYVGEQKVWPGFFPWLLGATRGSVPAIQREDELEDRLRGHVDYFAPTEPPAEIQHTRVPVEMGPEQAELYQAMWDKVPFWTRWKLRRNFPLSKSEMTRLTAFLAGPRQVSLSTLPFMGEKDPLRAFEGSPKLRRAFEEVQKLLENPAAKALVFSNFIDAGLTPYRAKLDQAGVPSGVFHGGLTDRERQRLVNDYNANKLRVLLLGPSGGEGLSLKGTQLIQLLDPHWHESRGKQQQGRGIRFDSHADLPPELQNVQVQRYISTLPPGWWDRLKANLGDGADSRASDSYLEELSARKEQLNAAFTDLLRRVGSERPLPETKEAEESSWQGSLAGQALLSEPVQYDPQSGILPNVMGHFNRVYERGQRFRTEQNSLEQLRRDYIPGYLRQQAMSGARPAPPHPVDAALYGPWS